MAQVEVQDESAKKPMEEITEEQFLKNLYLFMKKRDTPIERIPNLGFKQIDLFLMFKTVNDLGGYHQVTSHQLWKRVYNTLGGNPRSTSAATCTRRHYEKLLLPYECQLKGILMSSMPQHQSRPYRDPKDSLRPSKRGLVNHCFQSDPDGNIYSPPFHYYPTGWSAHTLLPHFVSILPAVIPPHIPPPPKVPCLPSHLTHQDTVNVVKEPLGHLRRLAKEYKHSSGLSASEPLNLSTKAPAREPDTDTDPPSSFGPPSSSKTPKFLNRPSTLYAPHSAGAVRSDGSETQESDKGVPTLSESEKKESSDADVQAPTPSDSPIFISAVMPEPNKGVLEMTPKPGSLKADFPVRPPEDREVRTEVEGFNLSHVLHSIPKDEEGKMEIEVPLSVVRNWLRLYGSSAKPPEAEELPIPDYDVSMGKKRVLDVDVLPTVYETPRSPPCQSSAEDLRLRNKPGLMPNAQADHHQESHLTGCKTSGGLLRNVGGGRNVWPLDHQDINKPYMLNSTDFWDACPKETTAPRSPVKPECSPPRKSSKFYMEDLLQRGMQRLEVEPSAVLMLKSSPASRFPLTADEMIKLQNISSSL
ncbi:AT-rich interaction domain 6 isoform X1 [Gambusia affinis]|uniref:AT-rich interaction domain 6 isoform X1 n=2 Tax=Gambusia affinis TaxID=33528 RepID=UPI001CDC9200|nr:AT-rich interaction domain 6 isoform X1 [Gambusia affinis]